jgi:hypothetical protein
MKKSLIGILLFVFCLISVSYAEQKLERFNNISIYQNPQFQSYKVELFTSLRKGTWFLNNVFDVYANSNYHYLGFYTITTAGKYITKNLSVRIQFERLNNSGYSRYQNNYYVGLGLDF